MTFRRTALAITTLATGIVASPLTAQATLSPADRAALDSMVDFLAARELVPGISIAIVSGDRLIYRRDAGWADREAGRKVDANTVFYIASVTKPFTALTTTLLDRDHIITLDETVAQLLPGATFGPGVDAAHVTVRQLLSHTSGINGDGPVVYRTAFSGEIDRAALLHALTAHGPAEGGTAFR